MDNTISVLKYIFIIFISISLYREYAPVQTKEIEVEVEKTVYVDCVEVITDTFEIYIPTKVDTDKVIEDYYTRKRIVSEYKDDHVHIQINDNLFNNSIEQRKLNYTILPRADPLRWFVNTKMYVGKNNTAGVAVGLSILKDRNQYSLCYDPINNYIFFGFNYQLKIRSPTKSRGLINLL